MIKDILNTIINELDVESQFKFVKFNKMMYNLLRNKCITYKKSTKIIERCYIKYLLNRGINVYTFALNPINVQPSGTVNLSRLNETTLVFDITKPFQFVKHDHLIH
jgi:hypothetical protein